MKNKLFFPIILTAIFGNQSFSQSLAINTDGSTANASALLDIKTTVKGMLIPRMSRTERNSIAAPATGLLIFQNAPDSIGFYYYNGTGWTWMFSNSNADSLAWRTSGNTATLDASNFIGTTDNKPFNIRVNNQKAGRIDNTLANAFWGYQAGNANSTGINNIAVGSLALTLNNTGYSNTAIGYQSLTANTGGYQNIAIGKTSMYSNISGVNNTAVGVQSLYMNTTGIDNTAYGPNSLFYNNGNGNTAFGWSTLFNNSSGNYSTAVGYYALGLNTIGYSNVAVGVRSLYNNISTNNLVAIGDSTLLNNTGVNNTAVGSKSLYANTTAGKNTAIGYQALYSQSFSNSNTPWNSENIAIGDSALYANQPTTITNAYQNTAVGNRSLRTNTIGWQNTALGTFSLFSNTIGQLNTASGWASLYKNDEGYYNTALGAMAMYYNTTGGYNVGVGTVALHNNLTGTGNTAVGQQAGLGTTGNSFSYNTIVGYQSGYNLTTGSNNVFLGNQAGYNVTSGSNKLYIANSSTNRPLIYGDFTSGYLGLGTASPSAKLHIGGGTRFTVQDTGAIFLQSGNTIGSARDWKIAVTLPNGYLTFRDMGFDNTGTGAMTKDAMVIAWGTGNVGIGTSTPNSTLYVDGTLGIGTSLNIAGGTSGSPVSLLNQKSYVGVLPANAINNYYQLPDPTLYPGRTYIIRNNSSVDPANITTALGLLFPGNSNVGGTSYTLNPTSSPKTVMAISDGANWTIMVQN